MSRELKFRLWDNNAKKWLSEGESLTQKFIWNFTPELSLRSDVSGAIEQYTGLKDKNGKEIYEGDIVRQVGGNLVCPVEFKYGGFVPFTSDMMLFDNDYCEVIGNIHENPELLGGGK